MSLEARENGLTETDINFLPSDSYLPIYKNLAINALTCHVRELSSKW